MRVEIKRPYNANVTCVDGSVKNVKGVAVIENEEQDVGSDYLLKCQILIDNFRPGKAVGTDNVQLLS